ncbi:hypothetical protein LB505_004870 [Fusarium chuoi]|nr:hypothetical protein LB505_004870 [Fusarium chuoi]
MQIEDHVRLIPPPMTGPDEELENKHKEWATILETYNARLWQELKVHEQIGVVVPHPFIAFLSCAKGEKAIPRRCHYTRRGDNNQRTNARED